MSKPIETWKGLNDFNRVLTEMRAALVHQVPEDIAVAMANLQGFIDWFQTSNEIELCAQRIEAEFSRYDESYDEITTEEWPPAEGI